MLKRKFKYEKHRFYNLKEPSKYFEQHVTVEQYRLFGILIYSRYTPTKTNEINGVVSPFEYAPLTQEYNKAKNK